jgi:hypothetical protein
MESLLCISAGALGILFRYQLGLTNACKVIGVQISSGATKTGYQDAITPPSSTNLTLLTWALIIALLLYSILAFGWIEFGMVAGTFLVVSTIAGVSFIPKPDSQHYVKRIYRSMTNRYADYEKVGDRIRSDAMKQLIDKVGQHFGDKLA